MNLTRKSNWFGSHFCDLNQAFRRVWMSSPRHKYVMLSMSLLRDFPIDAVVFGAEAHRWGFLMYWKDEMIKPWDAWILCSPKEISLTLTCLSSRYLSCISALLLLQRTSASWHFVWTEYLLNFWDSLLAKLKAVAFHAERWQLWNMWSN